LFGVLPPRTGIGLAELFPSKAGRKDRKKQMRSLFREEKECIDHLCKEVPAKEYADYFIFGTGTGGRFLEISGRTMQQPSIKPWRLDQIFFLRCF